MQVLPFVTGRPIGALSNLKSSQSDSRSLDLDFLLKRLACKREDAHLVLGSISEVPPFACEFRKGRGKGANLLAVATEDGDILMLNDCNKSGSLLVNNWNAHSNAIFDISWLPDKPGLITGSGDHTAVLWDVTTCRRVTTFIKHTGSVKCVEICPEQSAVFATGSRDGSINIWDTRINRNSNNCTQKPEITIIDAHNQCEFGSEVLAESKGRGKKSNKASVSNMLRSVTSVAFQDDYHIASAGVADGAVKIWDLRKTYSAKQKKSPVPKHILLYGEYKKSLHGCTSLVFDSTSKHLYACCTNNMIFHFDCHTYKNQYTSIYHGFKASTYFVKMTISNDDKYLLCGSSDENAYIWKLSEPGLPAVTLSGHSAEVTSVAWHPTDMTKLATCGDDNRVLVWKIKSECNTTCENNDIIGSTKPFLKDSNVHEKSHISQETALNVLSSHVSPSIAPKEKSIKLFFSPLKLTNNTMLDNISNTGSTQCKNVKFQTVSTRRFMSSKVSPLISRKRKYTEIKNEKSDESPPKSVLNPHDRPVLSPAKSINVKNRLCNDSQVTITVAFEQISRKSNASSQGRKDKENYCKINTIWNTNVVQPETEQMPNAFILKVPDSSPSPEEKPKDKTEVGDILEKISCKSRKISENQSPCRPAKLITSYFSKEPMKKT